MHNWLRFTALTTFVALGVAVAVGVALHKPPQARAERPRGSFAPRPTARDLAASRPAPDRLAQATAPPRDPVSEQMQSLEASIERGQKSTAEQQKLLEQAIGDLQQRIAAPPMFNQPAAAPSRAVSLQPEAASTPPALEPEPLPATTPGKITRGEGDDKLVFDLQNTDIRQVLEILSREGDLNILASPNVKGTVTASLSGMDVDTAMAAILKSTGFVSRREGKIIYVGTPADFAQMDQTQDKVGRRVYRPNYVRAAEFQALITSMLTPEVGKVTVSSPAEVDIPADQVKTGGNSFAGTDVIIVCDYEAVLDQVDQVFAEVDVKPKQVAIEAMIMSVRLSDECRFGVNFEALRNRANVRMLSGSPLADVASIDASDGGLKFGFLDSSLGLFIDALETVGDTNVIASPKLTCLNKQRAEIQIGEELGYVSTTVTENSATQSVNFLDTGTLLRIRPTIGNDGLIRLEVHPELSTGSVTVEQGLTLPNKSVTQVTTNVLCADGCTVIIGGLIREDLQTNTSQLPLLGNLPYVGGIFRNRTQNVDRVEIIVLITPRIVNEPMLSHEGQKYGNTFAQRQSVYFDKMSPIGKRNYGNHYLRLARAAFNAGDYPTALRQVNLAIHFDPMNSNAITLRNDVVAAGGFQDESIHQYLHQGLGPVGRHRPDYSRRGYPWKDFEGFTNEREVTAFDDPGQPGPTRNIETVVPGVLSNEQP